MMIYSYIQYTRKKRKKKEKPVFFKKPNPSGFGVLGFIGFSNFFI